MSKRALSAHIASTMKKRIVAAVFAAVLLAASGCHLRPRHPHGMPPGQASKVGPAKLLHHKPPGHRARPWR